MRLLVVEDEPRISELIKAALERADFVVDTVRVRADAREALANTPYDAAILDLGLPDGDGLDLLAELRPAGNHIPILILTARDAVEQRVLGLDAGADDYLVKPFAMSELLARTKALLRRPGAALGTTLRAGNTVFDTIGRESSIRAGSFHVPGALGWSRSGRVSRPLAIAVGGRCVDRLLPDCRCPPARSLRETMFCSPAFGPFGGAGYVSFSRAALPHGAGVS